MNKTHENRSLILATTINRRQNLDNYSSLIKLTNLTLLYFQLIFVTL